MTGCPIPEADDRERMALMNSQTIRTLLRPVVQTEEPEVRALMIGWAAGLSDQRGAQSSRNRNPTIYPAADFVASWSETQTEIAFTNKGRSDVKRSQSRSPSNLRRRNEEFHFVGIALVILPATNARHCEKGH